MISFRRLHRLIVADRRERVLADHLCALIPEGSHVLDVGCGDAGLTECIARRRPELRVEGIEVYKRPEISFPIHLFDGKSIPFEDDSVDVVVFVDVLHHTDDPRVLLREAARVARRAIVLKDHTLSGPFADFTLRFMDHTGNPAEGVEFPYNYWPKERWDAAFQELGLGVAEWRGQLRLFPIPADWIFGRGLHFAARLDLP